MVILCSFDSKIFALTYKHEQYKWKLWLLKTIFIAIISNKFEYSLSKKYRHTYNEKFFK